MSYHDGLTGPPTFLCFMLLQLRVEFALDLMIQLALGVRHMHSCGILHRDLKADNALVQSIDPLVVKWADYGWSVQMGKNKYGDGGLVWTSFFACRQLL